MLVRVVRVLLISTTMSGLLLGGYYWGATQPHDLRLVYQPASDCEPEEEPTSPSI